MLCPACKGVEMFVLEFEQVEMDYCYKCGGVWLDSGELELIGRRAGAVQGELLRAQEQGTGRRTAGATRRRCPVCRSRLEEVTADTDPPIAVDRCPAQHGLWFDRGELNGLIKAAGAQKDNVLARFFAELGAPGKAAEQHSGEGD